MADTHVEAEFQNRKRIVFTARDRAQVNVRVDSGDGTGPVGYTSHELLLIALANCTLGVVMGHDSLKDLPVHALTATLDATSARAPSRVDSITMRLELEVEGGNERLQQTLQRVAESCPIGNTLRTPPQINIELAVKQREPEPVASASD